MALSKEENSYLEPVYDIEKLADPFVLKSGKVKIPLNDKIRIGDYSLCLKTRVRPTVYVTTTFQYDSHDLADEERNRYHSSEEFKLTLDDKNTSLTRRNMPGVSGDGEGFRLEDMRFESSSPDIDLGNCESSSYYIFHLFNFPNFQTNTKERVIRECCAKDVFFFHFESSKWDINLNSIWETKENNQHTKETGQITLSHVGKIKPKAGRFTADGLLDLRMALDRFFSFVCGRTFKSSLFVGFDSAGNVCHEIFPSPMLRKPMHSSFQELELGNDIEIFFQHFMAKWDDPQWHDTMQFVTYCYVNGSDASDGVEPCIIVLQAALERLAFVYLVLEKKILTVKGFKVNPAATNLKSLLSNLSIDLNIPEAYTQLRTDATNANWDSGPHAITDIRNDFGHAVKRKPFADYSNVEAWKLSLWYVECVIFAICDYHGNYYNRISGKIEKL